MSASFFFMIFSYSLPHLYQMGQVPRNPRAVTAVIIGPYKLGLATTSNLLVRIDIKYGPAVYPSETIKK